MKAGIALGSNIEPRLLHLSEACHRVRELHEGSGPVVGSKVYESAPVDCPADSPPFLNAAIEIETSASSTDLLSRLQQIERDLGRPTNHGFHLPRTIDLDLLYLGDVTVQSPELTLPHPSIAQRTFVLTPLSDLRPDLVLPGFTESVAALLGKTKNSSELNVYSMAIY